MPGSPFRRAALAKIKELGGWTALLEKRAAGGKWKDLAAEVGVSRPFLRFIIKHGSDKLREAVDLANQDYAEHLAEESLEIVDATDLEGADRDALERAKLRAAHRRWLASVYDREKFGEPKDKPLAPQLSIGELHIQALIQGAPVRAIPARVTAPAQLPSGPSVPVADVQSAEPVSEDTLDG